jgi:hypothetical protein
MSIITTCLFFFNLSKKTRQISSALMIIILALYLRLAVTTSSILFIYSINIFITTVLRTIFLDILPSYYPTYKTHLSFLTNSTLYNKRVLFFKGIRRLKYDPSDIP